MEEPTLIKRNDRIMDKQKRILIIATVLVVTLFFGTSYALLTNFDTTSEVVTITVGNLNATITNTDNLVNHELSGGLPESDSDGLTNASPITLTITNTGTINIMKYELKLVSDANQTSTLAYNCIKYAISTDNGTTYSTPANLADSNNIIYTGYNLAVSASKTIKVKLWIDEASGNQGLGKTFYGSVSLELYQKAELPGSAKVLEAANSIQNCTRTVTDTDGIIYISGKSDNPNVYSSAETDPCVIDFNYVWWSGKMWRITAIYPDGAMKMVTDNNITTLSYGRSRTYYTKPDLENNIDEDKSDVFQWLNEDFLDTLYNHGEDVIDYAKSWNWAERSTSSTIPPENDETMVSTSVSPLGLLNSYEMYKMSNNNNSYLRIKYSFLLLDIRSNQSLIAPYSSGGDSKVTLRSAYGIRPAIIIKSGIMMSGNGTKTSPYRIATDYADATANDSLYTRHSGEYIKFASDGDNGDYTNAPLYRIVEVVGSGSTRTTKIVSMNFASYDVSGTPTYTKKFGAQKDANGVTWGTCTSNDCWNYYLNDLSGEWYQSLSFKNKLTSGIYYLGMVSDTENYKLSVCSSTNFDSTNTIKDCITNGTIAATWTGTNGDSGNVGILRYGEMFATQQSGGSSNSFTMWLITPAHTTSNVWNIQNYNKGVPTSSSPTTTKAVRPSYFLKSSVNVLSGSGTEIDPFIVD